MADAAAEEAAMTAEYQLAFEPAPTHWPQFPLALVRLMEETYDILLADGDGEIPTWPEIMTQMVLWMPGIGLDPWPDWEEASLPARRYMLRHLRAYQKAGCPEGGVEPSRQEHAPRPPIQGRVPGQCAQGHNWADNAVYRSNGRRECRVCKREWDRRRNDRKVENRRKP